MKKPYTLTALVFLAFIFGLGIYLLLDAPTIARSALTAWRTNTEGTVEHIEAATAAAEEAINVRLRKGNLVAELYGGMVRLAGKRVSEDPVIADYSIARLDNGAITFVNLDLTETRHNRDTADSIERWSRTCGAADVPLLYVAYPRKTPRQNSGLPVGLTDWPVVRANGLAADVVSRGIDTLDLRDTFEALGDYSRLFFRTDHHWTIRGGLFAYQTIADALRTRYGLTIDPFYEDEANYNFEILEDWFLGSQGKRIGTLFAGVDDFEVMTPAFDTDFTFNLTYERVIREGPMVGTILFPERVAERDYYGGNPYTYYSGGDYAFLGIVNHRNPDGPSILLVRDSMACAVTPFLACACSALYEVDTRYYDRDVAQTALDLGVDMVIVMVSG